MSCTSIRAGLCALIAGALVPIALAQDTAKQTAPSKDAPKGTGASQRVAGVIVKVEPVEKGGVTPGSTIERLEKEGKQPPRTVRLTVNADAIWADWVRDQATTGTIKTTDKAARSGAKSVATEGQPKETQNLVMIDLMPKTVIETRFRASTDETSKGSSTPQEARKRPADPAASGGEGAESKSEKPLTLKADDLKEGLFIEVDYKHVTAMNLASTVSVIRPIGGPETSADRVPEDTTKPSLPAEKK